MQDTIRELELLLDAIVLKERARVRIGEIYEDTLIQSEVGLSKHQKDHIRNQLLKKFKTELYFLDEDHKRSKEIIRNSILVPNRYKSKDSIECLIGILNSKEATDIEGAIAVYNNYNRLYGYCDKNKLYKINNRPEEVF